MNQSYVFIVALCGAAGLAGLQQFGSSATKAIEGQSQSQAFGSAPKVGASSFAAVGHAARAIVGLVEAPKTLRRSATARERLPIEFEAFGPSQIEIVPGKDAKVLVTGSSSRVLDLETVQRSNAIYEAYRDVMDELGLHLVLGRDSASNANRTTTVLTQPTAQKPYYSLWVGPDKKLEDVVALVETTRTQIRESLGNQIDASRLWREAHPDLYRRWTDAWRRERRIDDWKREREAAYARLAAAGRAPSAADVARTNLVRKVAVQNFPRFWRGRHHEAIAAIRFPNHTRFRYVQAPQTMPDNDIELRFVRDNDGIEAIEVVGKYRTELDSAQLDALARVSEELTQVQRDLLYARGKNSIHVPILAGGRKAPSLNSDTRVYVLDMSGPDPIEAVRQLFR